MPVSFNVLAERELNEAAQYYESEQAGLGAAFLSDVRRCTEAVVANEVRVLAVMNLRRRPGYWVGRH